MITLQSDIVEKEVIKVVKEICDALKIDAVINNVCRPGDIIKSQVLLTVIDTIGEALGVKIPKDSYIFREKNHKELSIKETAQKIINVAVYEK